MVGQANDKHQLGTNPWIKTLRQGHGVWDLTNCCAIKETQSYKLWMGLQPDM